MSKTLTLEGDVNAVDTLVRLTEQGSVSAPSRVTPSKSTKIVSILAAVGADGLAEGSAAFLIRLGGQAIKNGEQEIVFAAAGSNLAQSGSDVAPIQTGLFKLHNADIAIAPSEVLDVAVEMVGVDLGDSTVVITLIFD